MIALNDVTKRYPDGTVAVGNLTMEMASGEITVLLGSSGCGKTTTLRMINRLIEPTSGTIELDGRDLGTMPVHELRRGIGYVIQQAGLFPHRTVADNIATVPKLLGWDKERQRKRSLELIELVGLEQGMADRYPRQLSGGQQQRVGVARALAADPPVLLMDEPFGAVDPVRRGALQQEFKRLQRELGKTVVFVTHDVDEAVLLGDRIAIMQRGRPDRPVRPAGRAARPAGERLRGVVHRRHARAEAAVAALCVGGPGHRGGRRRPRRLGPDAPTATGGRCAGAPTSGDGQETPVEARRPEGLDARPDRLRGRLPRPRRGARGRGRQAGRGGAVLDPDRAPAGAGGDRRRAAGGALMLRWDWLEPQHRRRARPTCSSTSRSRSRRSRSARVIAFPVGLIAYRWRRSYPPILAITQVLYTIPSLALFVLLINAVGLGTEPVIIGLAIYSLVILVRNLVEGLRGVPPEVTRRRHRDGLQETRRLFAVELPLALPAIVAGLRVATVSTISLVSVGALIGTGGLGQLFIHGFQIDNPIEIWTGILLTVVLALVFDLLIVGGGRLLTPWTRAAR